jgi:hypothetical protein
LTDSHLEAALEKLAQMRFHADVRQHAPEE